MADIIDELTQAFAVSTQQLQTISANFQAEIQAGLHGKASSFKMLRSLLPAPSANLKGDFLSLDLGGTNARAVWIKLLGNGRYTQKGRVSAALHTGSRDYRDAGTQAHELFDFLAALLTKLQPSSPDGYEGLGFTFSFPYRQESLAHAELVTWTKGFRTNGVAGQDVGRLLSEALARQSLPQIPKLKAIINDTVGTLLTAAYSDQNTGIGSILGTGHNTCYLEPRDPRTGGPMIINLESGNFRQLPVTPFDEYLDRESNKPGQQRLEKMVSGKYLGELFRLILGHLISRRQCSTTDIPRLLQVPYSLNSADMSIILIDSSSNLRGVEAWLEQKINFTSSTMADRTSMKEAALMLAKRSARLVGATYAGILRHIDTTLSRQHTIAVDGSLYEKMPGYRSYLFQALQETLEIKSPQITVKLVQNGSQIGGAIAAAMAGHRQRV